MMNSLNTMYAKEMLISLANKLPENLLLDAVNEHGMFTATVLLHLTEAQLCDLRKEARLHKTDNVFLFFYSVSEKNLGKQHAAEVKDFTTFDFSKVVDIQFNGSCAPLLQHNYLKPIHYVSTTFVLKDEE